MLLGRFALALHQRDLAEPGMRGADVGIERERPLVVFARRREIAGLETQRAERQLDAGLLGRKRVRANQQILRLGIGAALVAQQAEQMQRVGIVRLGLEVFAVAPLGLVETTQAVQFNRVFQHDGSGMDGKRGLHGALRGGTNPLAPAGNVPDRGPQSIVRAGLRATQHNSPAATAADGIMPDAAMVGLRAPRGAARPPSTTTTALAVSANQDLATLLRSRTPLILVDSAEEGRVVEGFRHAIAQSLRPLYRWSITGGLRRLDVDSDDDDTPPDASMTLHAIKQQRTPGVYLLLDFQPYLRYPMTLRLLREIVQRLDCAEHTLALVGTGYDLPPELAAVVTRFEPELPDAQALAALLREEAFNYSRENGRRVTVDAEAARAVVRNLKGLSLEDARRIVRKLIYHDGALTPADLPGLAQAKYRLLDRDGLLHFEYETAQFASVAGLSRLKHWIAQRRPAFLGEKAAAKLDPPRGVLLLGVQGCGKSLAAKATAGGFGVPLLRLDIGTLYNKYHGETERNLREALKSAELLAPCVLWIDEIEKALATAGADDGVSRRVLGYLLTWMAERAASVFLVATANDVQVLPAELLRKGRFDEVFFVDLPDRATRVEIFRLHLARRDLRETDHDLGALADATDGFSGAEIEQIVVAALYAAAADKVRPTQQHFLAEIGNTRPLSVLMAERVAALREWARGRTVPAG
jgi:hypothetical protein